MISYNNSAPTAVNNVGQFGATEGSIGAYKSAAEYAADSKYWALLSQKSYDNIGGFLEEVERLFTEGELLKEDVEVLKLDFENQNQILMGLIQQAGEAVDNTNTAINSANAATDRANQAVQDVLAQLDKISNMSVVATTLPPGSMATGSFDNATGVFSFGIPEGLPGKDGKDGTISDIGKVSIGTPVYDDYGLYVDKEDGGLYRTSMVEIANLVPSVRSVSINGEEQTGEVSFNSVSSFNTRTGDVLPMSGDYSVSQITGAAASGTNSDITSLAGLTTALSVAQGGTGASTPEEARTNLELGLVATESIVPITKGGTGATSSENARLALVSAKSGDNYDITSLNNLTTALSINQGGTGTGTQSEIWGKIRPVGPTPLNSDPVGPSDAATKNYVDTNVTIPLRNLWERSLSEAGLNLVVGNFTTGATLTKRTDVLLYSNDEVYQWLGVLPKVVPPNSTVASTGGVGPTSWGIVQDIILRDQFVVSSNDNIRQMIRDREDALKSNKIRFVTWNNWGAGSISGYFGGDYANRQRIVDINTWWLRVGADFVGGQESYCVPNLRAPELALYPYGSSFQSTSEWFRFGRNYGNMVASTRPLTNTTGPRFVSSPIVGDTEYRSYVRTEMDVNGTTVVIYNIHLALSQSRITAMIAELADMAESETHSHIVLMGDWNTNSDADFQPFIAAGFTMVNKNGEINTSNNGGTWYIDRIFHKGFSAQGDYGSVDTPLAIGDHKPLYVDLTI